jgi:hypothetical protein
MLEIEGISINALGHHSAGLVFSLAEKGRKPGLSWHHTGHSMRYQLRGDNNCRRRWEKLHVVQLLVMMMMPLHWAAQAFQG